MTTEAGGHVSEMKEPLEAAALGATVGAAVVGALDVGAEDGLVPLELQAAMIEHNNAMVTTVAITDGAVRSARRRSLNGVIDSSVGRHPQRPPSMTRGHGQVCRRLYYPLDPALLSLVRA